MNSDKYRYKDILANYLRPILSDSDFCSGRGFQQDLAPCHISNKMQTSFCIDRYNPVRLAREFPRLKLNWKSLGNNQKKTF